MTRSVTLAPDTARGIRNAKDARDFASQLIHARGPDSAFDARHVLSEFPELTAYDSAVLDVIFEEYARHVAAGTRPDPQQFAARFPRYHSAVLEHISAHGLLEHCFRDRNVTWPLAGDTVLGCRLEEEIGRGAVSRVFLARQPALGDRRVVVKFCRFGEHEAQLLGKLRHEQIVEVYSVDTDTARRLNVLVMPDLGRTTLKDVVDLCFSGAGIPRTAAEVTDAVQACSGGVEGESHAGAGPRPPAGSYCTAMTRLMLDVARGVAYAHGRGVLHADIKPSNVLVTQALRAKVLDFNLSRDATQQARVTGGTVPYMAPEQLLAMVQGHEPAPAPAADIHAFGATFYECLAGSGPFGVIPLELAREAQAAWVLERRAQGVTPLRHVAPQVPRAVARLVDRCLSFDPRDRPPSMDDVVAALSREQRLGVRSLRWCQQRPRLTALASASVVLLLASGLAWHELADPRYLAELEAARRAAAAGEYDRAEKHFVAAVAELPHDADSQLRLTMLYERGRARLRQESTAAHDAAYDDFMEVLRIDPRHAAARASAGYARVVDLMAGRESARQEGALVARSRDDFEQALKLGLDTPELRFDFACCRLLFGEEVASTVELLVNLKQSLADQGDTGEVYVAVLIELARVEFLKTNRNIPDTSYCEEAARFAPDRGDIAELAAATLLRKAALERQSQDSIAASASLGQAAGHFRRAVNLGVATDKLTALRSLNPDVANDARFSIPTGLRAATSPSGPPQLFFDPLRSVSPVLSTHRPQ